MYPPSGQWVGRFSDRPSITHSGIWNVDHTDRRYDPNFLEVLRHYVDEMIIGCAADDDEVKSRFAPDGWRIRRVYPTDAATLW
jgi:hypothetical protein